MSSSSSIPDGISFADLQALAEDAPSSVNADKKSMTESEMRNLVAETVEGLTDKFDTVFGYKLTAYYALGALYHHHNEVFVKATADDDHDTALCWARDAGWIQVMLKCLNDIHLGPEDFMAPED
jgi:hypothetical protein